MAQKVQEFDAKLLVDCKNGLGECPIWDERQGLLCWVDIFASSKQSFWTYDPVTTETISYDLPDVAGSFALCSASTDYFLFAFKHGVAFYNPKQSTYLGKNIFSMPPHSELRLNDGRCDDKGRFIVGGYVGYRKDASLKNSKMANVYRINTDGSYQVIIKGVSCANSICFDDDAMYFTDTRNQPKEILKYSYFDDFRLPNKAKSFVKFDDLCNKFGFDSKKGGFDGSVVDKDGYLWNALVGHGKVVRYDKNGNVDMIINVPVPWVTCLCFGGKDLDILYITTIGDRSIDGDGGKGGGIYSVRVPVKGKLENKFKGTPFSTGAMVKARL